MEQMKGEYLATEKISKLMIKFAIPSIIGMLVISIYNIVDQIFIGWGIGYLGNGATNVVYPITVFALGIALLVGEGASAYFSISKGRGRSDRMAKCAGNAAVMLAGCGILLSIVCFLFKHQLIMLFGGTTANYVYASQYFTVIACGLPFLVMVIGISAIIRADGNPQYAMKVTLTGALINVVLDPIAIFVLNMGMVGAGLATISGQIVSCLMGVAYLRKMQSVKLDKSSFKLEKSVVKRSATFGMSSFLTQVSIVVFLTVMNQTMVTYGGQSIYGEDIPLTVMGIVMKVFQIAISFVVGLSVGCQPIVGYNMGARNYKRIKEIYKTLMISQIICAGVMTLLIQLFPAQIIGIFGSESALYNEFAVMAFRIFLSTLVITSIVKGSYIFLQGLGKPYSSLIIALMRDIVVSSIAAVSLAYFFGVKGALFAYPVADVVTIAVTFFVMKNVIKDLNKKIKEHS